MNNAFFCKFQACYMGNQSNRILIFICSSSILLELHIFYAGNIHSFGLMFNDLLADLGAQTSGTTLVIGCYFSAQSFSGLFASALFRKFSIRSVGVFGAILYFSGIFLCVFVNSTEMLAFSFGILNGRFSFRCNY